MAASYNPWTSIADLMSGFVVVVLVLFAVATTLPTFRAPPRAPTVDPLRIRERRRADFFGSLQTRLEPFRREGVVRFDEHERILAFNEVSFAVGSACLTEEAERAIDAVAPQIANHLEADAELTVHVEGHTDPRAVTGLRDACGWFADNTQLSTLRAANVRARIVGRVRFETRARLPVTGWGADRPHNPRDPFAPENRRVELHFVWPASPSPDAGAARLTERPH